MVAPPAALSLLLIAVVIGTAWCVSRLQANVSDLVAQNVGSLRAGEELAIGVLEARSLWKTFQHTQERRHLEGIPALRQRTDHWLREAERCATTLFEQQLMVQIKQGYERFFSELDAARQEDFSIALSEERLAVLEGVLTNEVLRPIQEYIEYNEQLASRSVAQNEHATGLIIAVLLFLGAGGAGVGLVAGYGIARRVKHSIAQLSSPVCAAASKLNEVVSPIDISAGPGFPDLEAALLKVTNQIGMLVERLQESQQKVLQAEHLATVGQMAAGIAHEVRNPLMAMKLLLQSNGRDPLHLSRRDLEVLHEEIERLEQCVQPILDFARPLRLEKRRFDVQHLLEKTIHLISSQVAARGVRLEPRWLAGPVMLEADIGQIRQVLLNLLLNALDATPEKGTITVEMSVREAENDNTRGSLMLRVLDTGCGLPRDLAPRIFEPFVTTKKTGLGLGLSICKRIVEAHGGKISAANRDEGGTVFSVRLPLGSPGIAHRARSSPIADVPDA
jgi:signal transduction histidine kinase